MDKRYQVFVSSTYNDLVEERKEATQAILKCNCFPAGMELFPASNKKQWSVIKQVIDDSDFYLLILAGRYGTLGVDDTGKKIGYTEMEFDYALSKEKPIIVMLHRCPETLPSKLTDKTASNIKRLEKFRNKAMSGRLVAFWENKDQLNGEILSSLHKMMASTPEAVGWIRADTIPNSDKDKDKNTNITEILETFITINNVEDKIDYLDELRYTDLENCFTDKNFVKEFSCFINISQSSTVICSAIKLLPYSLNNKIKKFLVNMIDINALFFAQYKNGKLQGSQLLYSIIQLLNKLKIYSLDYSEPILNYLKEKSLPLHLQNICIEYIDRCRFYSIQTTEGKSLLEYVTLEFKNEQKKLSIESLAYLLMIVCENEYTFANVYNIFINSNREIQEAIIKRIIRTYGADVFIINPKTQRMFLDVCEKVFTWDDDEIVADLLLYCLFVRSYDIFTVEEIFNKLDEFNDDVFYSFVWQLSCGEFWSGVEEVYCLNDEEKLRVTKIIKKRKHPRGKKLLELFSK